MQRRRLLKLGLASAAVLAAVGGSLAMLRPGLGGGRLSPTGRAVFAGVGRAVLDGTLPASGSEHERALAGLLARVDALVAGLPDHARGELSQLLALLASVPGRAAMMGFSDAWETAPVAVIQRGLESMRLSRLALRQQAYHALHDIVGGAYFSDASSWKLLGYPGPVAL